MFGDKKLTDAQLKELERADDHADKVYMDGPDDMHYSREDAPQIQLDRYDGTERRVTDAVVAWLDQKLGRVTVTKLLFNWNEDYYNETMNEVIIDAILLLFNESRVSMGSYDIAELLSLPEDFVQDVIESYMMED